MKKLLKRFGAAFIVVAMLVAMIPMTVLAKETRYGFYLGTYELFPNGFSVETKINAGEGTNLTCFARGYGYDSENYITTFKYKLNGDNTWKNTTDANTGLQLAGKFLVNDADRSDKEIVLKRVTDVTFDKNAEDATEGSVTTAEATYGRTLPLIQGNDKMLPTRTGYIFLGYFDAQAGGTQYYKADGTANKNTWDKTDATVTLYAQWKEIKDAAVKTAPTANDLTYTTDYSWKAVEQVLITQGEAENGTMYYALQKGKNKPETDDYSINLPKAKNAGEYTVWYYVKSNQGGKDTDPASIPAEIKPAEWDLNWERTEGLVYDGTEKATPNAYYWWGGHKQYLDNVTIVTEDTELEFLNAGTYTFRALSNDGNYADEIEVTIAKAPLTAVWETKEYVYNGEEQTYPTVTLEGAVKNETPTAVATVEGDFVEADTYTFTAVLPETDVNANYTLGVPEPTKDYTIAPKELEASDFNFVKPVSSKFTGDAKLVKVNLLPVYAEDQENVAFAIFKDGEAVEEAVKPGKYTVRAKVASKNFKAKDVEVGSFVIEEIKFMEGDGSKYVVGSDGTLKFKTNGPYDYFEGVKVDGNTVDPKNYVVEEGSTLVTFKKAYAEKLAAGEHTIQFVYMYNVASPEATFTIEAKESPKTADANTTWLWILLGTLAGLALIAGAYKVVGSDI